MAEKIHPFGIIVDYVKFINPGSLENYPGIWESKINDDFILKLNPTKGEIDNIPPYHFYVTYKGWPFMSAFVGTGEGEIMHVGSGGEGEAIELFQKAVAERISKK